MFEMFEAVEVILKNVNQDIDSIREVIQTNDRLREIADKGIVNIQQSKDHQEDHQEIIELLKRTPDLDKWRLYEHCAVVTRLYAIYEDFVKNLISTWLRYLPKLVENYLDLDERIRSTHREGVGRILLELKKDRFQNQGLTENKVIIGLFNGTKGENKNYKLLQQAFLLHNQNLRKDVLEKLFADAGISNAWEWVIKHRKVIKFTREIEESKNNYEKELNKLISYRNEAAHGAVDVDEILFTPQLLNLGNFIKSLCPALAELVTYEIFKKQTDTGKAKEIGKVTEWYEKSKAAVAKINNSNLSINNSNLSIGTNVLLVKETSSDCRLARIESIKVNDTPLESIEITNKIEVGLKFDIDAKKELKIYIVVEDSG